MALLARCSSALAASALVLLGAPLVVEAAAPPPTLMQQGRIVEAGVALDGPHDLTFRLYEDTNANGQLDTGEAEIYLEQLTLTLRDGYYAAVLGLAGSHDLPAQIIASAPVLLTVAIDGGAELAAQPVTAVPYAFVAQHVEGSVSVPGGSTFECTGCLDAGGLFGSSVIEGMHVADGSLGRDDLGNDSVASAELVDGSVTSSDLGTNSVDSDELVDGSVTSAEIADGTITPDDVAGALYATKADLYLREATSTLSASTGTASATCDDTNDIAISWTCDTGGSNSNAFLKGVQLTSWSSTSAAAGVTCVVGRTGTTQSAFTARIFCSPVP